MSYFQALKKTISTLYTENSMAVTDGSIDMIPVLRECDKMELALEGDFEHVAHMEAESAAIKRKADDTTVSKYMGYSVESLKGPTPTMKKYGDGVIRQRKSAVVKWAIAKGRVVAAREILEALIAEEREAKMAMDSLKVV